jgi:hypothetical protein
MDWDVFWSVLFVLFVMVPLFMIWAFAVMDLFSRRDLSGLGKVLWLFFIIFLPIIGTLVYFLTREPTDVEADQPNVAAARAGYVTERLTELTTLKEKGVISAEEFEKQKTRLLGA